MKNLKMRTKLFLILLSLILPLGFVTYQLDLRLEEGIDFAIQQNRGVVYEKPLLKIMDEMADYQIAILRRDKGGDEKVNEDISAGVETIDKLFVELAAIDKEVGVALDFTEEGLARHGNQGFNLPALQQKWQAIKSSSSPTTEMFSDAQTHLARMIKHLGDASGMILDPDLDTYYLVDAALAVFPTNLAKIADLKSSVFYNSERT